MSDTNEMMIRDEETITWAQHEKEMTRMETANKRWFICFLVVLFMLFGTNVGWVIYESQFQDVTVTQESGSAPNNFIGNDGDIYNGQTDNQDPGETER